MLVYSFVDSLASTAKDIRLPLERALKELEAREAELARVQRIGLIGGLEVDLREGAFVNRRSPEYLLVHGLPPEAFNESHEAWMARIHPEDRDRVVGHFLRVIQSDATDYEVEYRIVRPSDGQIRWIMAKAEIERDATGTALRLVGAHIDITARRTAEEQRELISRELSHRIANIFTVVSSMIAMSARANPAAKGFAQELIGRIGALHRAHGMVVHKVVATEDDMLLSLLNRLVDPYRVDGADTVKIVCDNIVIGRSSATAIALVVHELATNAVKYGALSERNGGVIITVRCDAENARLRWEEKGGPTIANAPSRQGFGSLLLDRAAKSQLGASLHFDWRPSGVVVTIEMPTSRLAA